MNVVKLLIHYQILIFALISVPVAEAAEILYVESGDGTINPDAPWMLKGEIVKGDMAKLISTIKATGLLPRAVSLDSPGGDINEAIDIGLFLRRALIRYQSAKDENGETLFTQCSSACALIFFGAIERSIDLHSRTRIGLHKPSFNPDYLAGLTTAQAQHQYQKAEETLRLYLQEMSIPVEIADLMFRIDPASTRYFSDYRLAQWFPAQLAYEEWMEANCGQFETRGSQRNPTPKGSEYLGCKGNLEKAARTQIMHEIGCSRCKLN